MNRSARTVACFLIVLAGFGGTPAVLASLPPGIVGPDTARITAPLPHAAIAIPADGSGARVVAITRYARQALHAPAVLVARLLIVRFERDGDATPFTRHATWFARQTTRGRSPPA
jgi:hypothetical protein